MSIQPQTAAVTEHTKRTAKESFLAKLLDPVDRLVEAIYGVLIVMTFTLAARAITSAEANPRTVAYVNDLFWAALGCAVAWGLIDGVMYILSAIFDRGKERRIFLALNDVTDEAAGVQVIADETDDDLDWLTTEAERTAIYTTLYQRLKGKPIPRVAFESGDFAGALGIFLVALGSALPLLIPLLLFPNAPALSVRLSNGVAFVMLFGMGFRWAQYAGGKPWVMGSLLLLIGVVMVLIAIPLGG